MTISHYQLAIIGGGPAGMSAAITATSAGLSVIVLDDQSAAGGQAYRNLAANSVASPTYLGAGYYAGTELIRDFATCGAIHRMDCTIWQITASRDIALVVNGKAEIITADYIIIATGAIERPMPVNGWTLPGVMSVGGAQTLLKQAALGADEAVFVGTGPLLYLAAWQYIKAGLRVRALVDTTSAAAWRRALLLAPLALLQPKMMLSGLSWLRLIKRRTMVIKNCVAVSITGEAKVQSLRVTTASGAIHDIETAHVFLHQGVIPNTNLTMASGLEHRWDTAAHCWRPHLDRNGQSSDRYIYVVGDGSYIGGAAASVIAGRRGANAIIRQIKGNSIKRQLSHYLDNVQQWHSLAIRPFLDWLYLPPATMRLAQSDDTIICRCESVTKSDIEAALVTGVAGPNQLKAFCRAGMGRCQGRSCGLVVQEMIANHNQQTMAQTGYYRLRPPVKPITLAALASLQGPWPE